MWDKKEHDEYALTTKTPSCLLYAIISIGLRVALTMAIPTVLFAIASRHSLTALHHFKVKQWQYSM